MANFWGGESSPKTASRKPWLWMLLICGIHLAFATRIHQSFVNHSLMIRWSDSLMIRQHCLPDIRHWHLVNVWPTAFAKSSFACELRMVNECSANNRLYINKDSLSIRCVHCSFIRCAFATYSHNIRERHLPKGFLGDKGSIQNSLEAVT